MVLIVRLIYIKCILQMNVYIIILLFRIARFKTMSASTISSTLNLVKYTLCYEYKIIHLFTRLKL